MNRLSIVVLLIGGVLFSPEVSKAGMYLGSFENLPAGQDSPDAAVLAAIVAAGESADGVIRLYKSDVVEGQAQGTESGLVPGAFTITYELLTGKYNGSIVQDVDPIDIAGDSFVPLFYTVKIDGPNAGFNLYAWDSNGSNDFTNQFYKDTTNGLNYDYVDGSGNTQTNSWSDGTGTLTNYGVSHVSVWGAIDDGLDPGPLPGVPEPSALAVWGLLGMVGLAWRMRARANA